MRIAEQTQPAALPPENGAETADRKRQWAAAAAAAVNAATGDDLSDLKGEDPDETNIPEAFQVRIIFERLLNPISIIALVQGSQFKPSGEVCHRL